MTSLTISVAMATYNGATHLRRQLDDLAGQSLLPSELVVCDDGSDDDTLAIVRDFAASAPFPVITRRNPARLGYRENFIRCAELCSGELVAFCDQDDRWSPRKLEAIVPRFRDPQTMLVYHDARIVSDAGEVVGKLHGDAETRSWEALNGAPWMFSLGFTQVFRRSLVRFDDLWPASLDPNCDGERLAHDQWFFFLASVTGTILYVPDLLADYRQHGANVYGAFASSFRSHLAKEARDPSRAVARRLAAAESRASILEQAAERTEEPLKSRLLLGREMYREFAERYRRRASLYRGRSYRDRGRAFQQLIAARAYGRDAWRIGPLGFAMDCLLGLTGIRSFERG